MAHSHSRLIAPKCSPANRHRSSPRESPADQPRKHTCPPTSMAQFFHRQERRRRSWNFLGPTPSEYFTFMWTSPFHLTLPLLYSPVPPPRPSRRAQQVCPNWEAVQQHWIPL